MKIVTAASNTSNPVESVNPDSEKSLNRSLSVVLEMEISNFVRPTELAKQQLDAIFADAGMYRAPRRSEDLGILIQTATEYQNKKPKSATKWARNLSSQTSKLND
jgi:hypothetical protein